MPKHNDGLERYDSNLFSRPEKELKTLDLKLAIVEKEKLLKSIQCDAKDRRVEILTGRNRIDTWAHNLLADDQVDLLHQDKPVEVAKRLIGKPFQPLEGALLQVQR
ncbi:hypothetical protein PPACK8108_LOCUS17212 [Phakopsora pachyrhizi]|uniref:Uncharacterized protein n=1 Tax=Phakopsora pachyrhizi TaxID=170000 RepID=A0AAV0B9B1_PHAPC|nr:hypothetical protein PPACK8108_LOCUS17212 [Phakopsora pachyrhizi]